MPSAKEHRRIKPTSEELGWGNDSATRRWKALIGETRETCKQCQWDGTISRTSQLRMHERTRAFPFSTSCKRGESERKTHKVSSRRDRWSQRSTERSLRWQKGQIYWFWRRGIHQENKKQPTCFAPENSYVWEVWWDFEWKEPCNFFRDNDKHYFPRQHCSMLGFR